MKYSIISIIKLYQHTLSPDHSWLKSRYPFGFCRFYPSCSQYAVEAITAKGIIVGSWLALKRILRCNPFIRPGFDSVPK